MLTLVCFLQGLNESLEPVVLKMQEIVEPEAEWVKARHTEEKMSKKFKFPGSNPNRTSNFKKK